MFHVEQPPSQDPVVVDREGPCHTPELTAQVLLPPCPVPCFAWPGTLSSQLCGDARDRTILESSDLPPQTTRGADASGANSLGRGRRPRSARYLPLLDPGTPPPGAQGPQDRSSQARSFDARPVRACPFRPRTSPGAEPVVAGGDGSGPATSAWVASPSSLPAAPSGSGQRPDRRDRLTSSIDRLAGTPAPIVMRARHARLRPRGTAHRTRAARTSPSPKPPGRRAGRSTWNTPPPRLTRGRSPAVRSTRGATDTRTSSHRVCTDLLSPRRRTSRRDPCAVRRRRSPSAPHASQTHLALQRTGCWVHTPTSCAVRHGARRARHPDGVRRRWRPGGSSAAPTQAGRPTLSLTSSRQHQGPDQGVFACSGSTVFHVEHLASGRRPPTRGGVVPNHAASCLTASCVAPTDHTAHGRTSQLDPGLANRRDDHAAV
jgi:hypothetical protein